jgi:5-methylcytosine-specific restriction protein A
VPRKPPRPCGSPGCPELVEVGTRRCARHEADRHHAIDARRGNSSERGYGAAWQRLRLAFLASNPLCVFCLNVGRITAATVVDHLVPLADGGTNDVNNLRALCKPHHDARTMRDQVHARTAT